MRHLLIIILGLGISSCAMNNVTAEDLTQINNGLTLSNAKQIFEEDFDEDDIITKTYEDEKYTILVMKKITGTRKVTYESNNTFDSGRTNETMTILIMTKFYLVFKGENYFFSGFGYEAKNSPKSKILNSLIYFDFEEI